MVKTAACGFLLRDAKVLLALRSKDLSFYPNVWDAIGGHCQPGELPETALLRELQEEIGVIPTKYEEIIVLEDPHPEIHGRYKYHVFVVTDWIGEPRNLAPEEHESITWFENDEAQRLDLAHPAFPRIIESIYKKHRKRLNNQ
jgi:8-oxo-dGTP diphosphatase